MSRSHENWQLHVEPKKFTTVQLEDGSLIGLQAEPFWKNRPELWFEKIEAQLSNCNVSDDTKKFKFVVSLLDESTALEVQDIIIKPPEYEKYDFLREKLIRRITIKNEQEAKKRMMGERMGDRKPSQFFCYLNGLAGCYVRDEFVENIWFQCLPNKIRAVVECLKDYTIDTQTKIADRVHEVFLLPSPDGPINTSASLDLVECLVKEVEMLNKKVNALKQRAQSTRLVVRDIELPTKPGTDTPNQITQCKPCPYHTKYGVKLCKMRKNCN